MEETIIKRVLDEAKYMINTENTLREIAKQFGISKSTVHKDLKERLKKIDLNLYQNVQKIIKKHTEIRHIRGGQSTKKKYLKMHQ